MLQAQDTQTYDFDESEMTDIRELMLEEKTYECETWKEQAVLYKKLYENSQAKIISYMTRI